MKNIFKNGNQIILGLLFIVLGGLLLSCEKTINEPIKVAYLPTKLDEKAGNWKTYILTKADEILVIEPKAANSAEYLAELASLKTAISVITQKIKKQWPTGVRARYIAGMKLPEN